MRTLQARSQNPLPRILDDVERGESVIITRRMGAPMNIEADALLKLAAMQAQAAKRPQFELTAEWLVANGY